jgi:hypothetical protein
MGQGFAISRGKGIGKTVPNAKGNAKTIMELPDEARD